MMNINTRYIVQLLDPEPPSHSHTTHCSSSLPLALECRVTSSIWAQISFGTFENGSAKKKTDSVLKYQKLHCDIYVKFPLNTNFTKVLSEKGEKERERKNASSPRH